MAAKRKNLVDKQRRQAGWHLRRQRRLNELLKLMGLSELFPHLPPKLREFIADKQFPKPVACPEPGSQAHPDAPVFQRALEAMLDRAILKLLDGPFVGTDLSLNEFFARYVFVRNTLWEADRQMRGKQREVALAFKIADHFLKIKLEQAFKGIRCAVAEEGTRLARTDKVLFSWKVHWERVPDFGKRLKIAFSLTPAEQVRVQLDGHSRPAYRIGAPSNRGTNVWLYWTGDQIGIPGNTTRYPVLAQAHTLRRLEERIGQLIEVRGHYDLWNSVINPRFHEIHPDQWLVEYSVGGHRLGYLVARRAGPYVVLTTFLFLTMQGTPEAKLLYDKLKLCRVDLEYQKLDTLSAYLTTDIRNDPLLLNIFDECGCSHLFKVAELKAGLKSGYAEELRKFLRLNDRVPACSDVTGNFLAADVVAANPSNASS